MLFRGMSDTLTCSECGNEIESTDDLEHEEVREMEVDEDDSSFSLYESSDLYLCEGCRNPMGVGHSRSSD
jgi:hypothetical protein